MLSALAEMGLFCPAVRDFCQGLGKDLEKIGFCSDFSGEVNALCSIGKAFRHMVASRLRETAQAKMTTERIAIAADHGGFEMKSTILEELKKAGHEVLDLGTNSADSVDYPDFANALAEAVKGGKAGRGVLVCGTGIGISIAANRHKGIRAALCRDTTDARLAREHNDANVLVLGGRTTGMETAKDIVNTFMTTPFSGGRHARRVAKLG